MISGALMNKAKMRSAGHISFVSRLSNACGSTTSIAMPMSRPVTEQSTSGLALSEVPR